MATVALIGADGAGKTTVANTLVAQNPDKIKYIYMGGNLESSNIKLPTAHLIVFIRRLLKKNSDKGVFNKLNEQLKSPDEWWTGDKRGSFFAIFRLINRITEDFYRIFVSWIFQFRGFTVLYDRHVMFEKIRDKKFRDNKLRLTDKIHLWMINNIYPDPDYVIFLDAPPEVLFKRKKETTVEFIEYTRNIYLKAGEKLDNFFIVNVDKDLNLICSEIINLLFVKPVKA